MSYATDAERNEAVRFGRKSVLTRYDGRESNDFESTPLSRAEDFFKDEKERLDGGGEAPWVQDPL